LLASAVGSSPQAFGQRLGRLYATNTLGCAVGAFGIGFLCIPWLGIQATFGALIAGLLGMSVLAWSQARRPAVLLRFLAAASVVPAAVFAWHGLPEGEFLKARIDQPRQLVYYAEGDNATVSIAQEANGVRQLLVDGQPVAGTSATSIVDQKML